MGGYQVGCLSIKHGLELPSYELRLQAQIVPKMGFEGAMKMLWVPMSQKVGLQMLPLLLLLAAPLIRGDYLSCICRVFLAFIAFAPSSSSHQR